MIKYIKNYFSKIKEKSLTHKIVLGFILFLYIVIISLTLIRVNYITTTPGAANAVGSVIDIDSDYTSGKVYTVSVYEHRKVNLLHYFIANLSEKVNIEKFDPQKYMSKSEENIQGKIMKDTSIDYSLILAYNEANKTNENINIVYDFKGMIVHQIYEEADEIIQLEDLITHVDGEKITSSQHFLNLVEDILASNKDEIEFKVLRDSKAVTIKPKLSTLNNEKKIGISTQSIYEIDEKETTPAFTIKNTNTQGPSGGLMQTIAIYNAITKTDITKGKIIMGTGTININGEVGIIGGIKQKIITADLYNADIFFVPEANYEEALEQYLLLEDPSFELIMVKTFAEAISELARLS